MSIYDYVFENRVEMSTSWTTYDPILNNILVDINASLSQINSELPITFFKETEKIKYEI